MFINGNENKRYENMANKFSIIVNLVSEKGANV